jgi:serine/threonine protein kinase
LRPAHATATAARNPGGGRLNGGTLIGERYAISETIGSGGMAVVYRAHDRELGRDVAVKLLAEHLAMNEEFRERFLREGRMAAQLSHANIVEVYDSGEADGRPFLVMEHVDGVTLADELARRGRFPATEAVGLVLQACAGLQHAHEHGLVHRDIKPQNLLVRPDGVLKIADFGIARAIEGTQLTAVGTVLGTAVYAAPEQASGEQVTAVADIYSLGAVLYELIAGRPPFEFETLPELVLKQRAGRVASLKDLVPSVSRRLDEVVLHCLSPEPAARPPSAADLARELTPEAGTDHVTVVAPPQHRLTRARSRRKRWPFVAVAAVLLALVAGILLATGGDESPSQPTGEPGVVEPVPAASTPEERARNLAAWLRENSG